MRLLAVVFVSLQAIAAPALFIRDGAGHERSRDAAVRDRDCTFTAPPAFFGCGFEARGDFGRAPLFEAAAGFGSRARIELAIAHRALELEANANFTGVTRDAALGELRSPRGIATIVRLTRTLDLEIEETRADVATRGITLSLRWTR